MVPPARTRAGRVRSGAQSDLAQPPLRKSEIGAESYRHAGRRDDEPEVPTESLRHAARPTKPDSIAPTEMPK